MKTKIFYSVIMTKGEVLLQQKMFKTNATVTYNELNLDQCSSLTLTSLTNVGSSRHVLLASYGRVCCKEQKKKI
jgi:hypothetical protein